MVLIDRGDELCEDMELEGNELNSFQIIALGMLLCIVLVMITIVNLDAFGRNMLTLGV